MKIKFTITCFCLVLFCCDINAQVGNDGANVAWKTHHDSLYNFSFQYPTDWEFKLPAARSRFFVTSYPENDTDNFRENVNCIVSKMNNKGMVITDAEKDIKETLSGSLKDFTIIYSGYIKWNNVNTYVIKYTFNQESGGVTYYLKMYQQVALVKGMLYTLTFTSEAANYDKYEPAVKKMYQSFKIK